MSKQITSVKADPAPPGAPSTCIPVWQCHGSARHQVPRNLGEDLPSVLTYCSLCGERCHAVFVLPMGPQRAPLTLSRLLVVAYAGTCASALTEHFLLPASGPHVTWAWIVGWIALFAAHRVRLIRLFPEYR